MRAQVAIVTIRDSHRSAHCASLADATHGHDLVNFWYPRVNTVITTGRRSNPSVTAETFNSIVNC